MLVVRVHPEILAARRSSRRRSSGKDIWEGRYEDIRNFERYLARNGTVVRKFFLHVSRKEQKRRFLERLDEPGEELEVLGRRRAGAGSLEGVHGRLRGHDPPHRHAGARRGTSCRPTTSGSPGVVVAAAIIDALASLDLHYPKVTRSSSRSSPRRKRRCSRRSSAGTTPMLSFLKTRRRRALCAQPFPDDWKRILASNVPAYRRVPEDLRAQLHGHMHVFLAEKHFEGCNGLEITTRCA